MGKMRLDLEREVQQANTTFASNVMVNNGAAEALRNVSDLIKSDVNYIPYSTFAEMLHNENQLSTLGGTDPMASLFLRSSNKELKTFDYVEEHLEDMLGRVVRATENFAFRPAQRLVVAYYLSQKRARRASVDSTFSSAGGDRAADHATREPSRASGHPSES